MLFGKLIVCIQYFLLQFTYRYYYNYCRVLKYPAHSAMPYPACFISIACSALNLNATTKYIVQLLSI